jgi:hypothetical protein
MDASELSPIVGAFLAAALAGVVCWAVRRVPAKGLRIGLMGMTGLLAMLAVCIGGALLFFDMNYTRHLRPLVSPDGRHVATTSYVVGTGAAADLAEVAIRSARSPYAHRVYSGPAQYEPNAVTPEPEVRWIDDTHLEIRFHTYVSRDGGAVVAAGEQGCAGSADGIAISCVDTRVHAVR